MEYFELIFKILQALLAFFNVLILIYGFKKFLSAPHDSLESKIALIELEIKEIKQSLHLGNDKFTEQEKTNQVLIHSTLALIEFEIQYCLTEKKTMSKGLEEAKDDLNKFLSHR